MGTIHQRNSRYQLAGKKINLCEQDESMNHVNYIMLDLEKEKKTLKYSRALTSFVLDFSCFDFRF